tara:strand:- start:911 stop:3223 length:2313 start_codon:yes stop_codon:yes gene_type:complete
MADNNTIEINFSATGDESVIKAIEALDKSTKALIATQTGMARKTKESKTKTNLHKKAVQQLEIKLKALGFSFKKVSGAIELQTKALEGDKIALQKLKNTTNEFISSQKKGDASTRILGGTFAVLRSKMLLVNFALGLGIRQVGRLVSESAKVSAMETAFNTLAGSTGDSTLSMQKLEEATNGTMNQFNLFKQANNAMILGVADNSDTMAEMFDIAQRLGRALGQDTASSVESLITGIGRQSRLMLDNIGIIVDSEKAYKAYAEANSLVASELTDSQKKQAFLEATMKSAREKVATLGKENLTAKDKMNQLSTASSNLATTIGKQLSPAFGGLSSVTAQVINNLTKIIEKTTTEDSLETKHYKTIEKTNKFLKENAKQYGFVTNQSNSLISRLVSLRQKFIDLKNEQKANVFGSIPTEYMNNISRTNDLINKLTKSQQGFRESALEEVVPPTVSPPLDSFSKDMVQNFEDEFLKEPLEMGLTFPVVDDLFNDFMSDFESSEKTRLEILEASESARKTILANTTNFRLTELQTLENVFLEHNVHSLESEAYFAEQRKLIYTDEAQSRLDAHETVFSALEVGYDQFVSSLIDKDTNLLEKREAIVNATKNAFIKMTADIIKEKVKQMIIEKVITQTAQTSAIVSAKVTGVAIASAMATPASLASTATLGGASVAGQAGITASVTATKALAKFEDGGLVGGKRHSQGGTLIEAEQGEFVMSRSAVQSIGENALNNINQGNSGGITLNISAPLIDDTILDTIIPAIQKAQRMDLA